VSDQAVRTPLFWPFVALVEVDLDRQVLLVVNDDGGVRVLPISSGSGKPIVDEGRA
jgi:hypothetical protein